MDRQQAMQSGAAPATALLTRREFLRGTGVLFGTLWASSTALITLAPSRSWALELTTLSSDQGRSMMQLCRVLYPHPTLDDAVYAIVVVDLDGQAKVASTRTLFNDGLRQLDALCNGSFVSSTGSARLAAVKAIEGTPFFSNVRSTCVVALYNNQLAFAHFGYQGASWDKGGYILRGFNDLKWLPDPPEAASPKPYTG